MKVSIDHPTDRPNFTEVTLGDTTIYFSYRTPIAFYGANGLVIRENDWGPTTGKHLNYVSTTAKRVDGGSFDILLAVELGKATAAV
jgi:hypothetical protein